MEKESVSPESEGLPSSSILPDNLRGDAMPVRKEPPSIGMRYWVQVVDEHGKLLGEMRARQNLPQR